MVEMYELGVTIPVSQEAQEPQRRVDRPPLRQAHGNGGVPGRRPRGRAGAGPGGVYGRARGPLAVDNTPPGSSPADAAAAAAAAADAREEMYQARPLSRNLFLYTFLQNHGPGFLDDQGAGVTNILDFHPVSPNSDSPHYLAMQLASIADEMELRLLLPQFVEPIWMTMYSLFFPYSHVGLRDVLRSFMVAFTNLRENRRLRSFLTLRDRVSPSLWPELALSLLVVVMLSWG
ncbi:bcl-2-interacting killer [Hippopotamus amphibius kiboko]|uniref:bcl-2-interacting killer n=1 Tax=Hippopotamus amphibius kiboko TaxID=575201 RepID=UPI0025926C40|nr:bcl-2-interacting killer [Hippopotamus amphibius kiboko]